MELETFDVNRLHGWAAGIYILGGAIFGFTAAALLGWTSSEPPAPYPCKQHEVAVWTKYPDEIACVPDTDHAHHQSVSCSSNLDGTLATCKEST